MSPWLEVTLAVLAGLACVWLALVVALYVVGRRYDDPTRLREVLRLLPDVVRLLHRLSKDGSLPRGVRIRLWLLLAYLAFPLDLVPDFIPVLGYADDAVVVAMLIGVMTTRANGTLPRVAAADRPALADVVERMLAG